MLFCYKSLHEMHDFGFFKDEPEIHFRFFALLILVIFPHFQISLRFSKYGMNLFCYKALHEMHGFRFSETNLKSISGFSYY